jgi:hypothetical protein
MSDVGADWLIDSLTEIADIVVAQRPSRAGPWNEPAWVRQVGEERLHGLQDRSCQ